MSTSSKIQLWIKFVCYSVKMETPTYLNSLNERQKEAVLQTSGPVLIVAGAGAGKTKTLTHRILNLIHQGVSPHEILAITFTNKAALEMRERMEKLLQSDTTRSEERRVGKECRSRW